MLTRPAWLLRLEGALMFLVCLVVYSHFHAGWLLFALLFFTPDLFMLGYLVGPGIGAAVYNLGHNSLLPLLLGAALYFSLATSSAIAYPLIWFAHIGFDRMLGYGLKYPTAFKDTHLQRV
jgi:hypothetical protein